MSVLAVKEQLKCSTEFSGHKQATISNGNSNSLTQKIKYRSLPKVSTIKNRKEKISNIRHQLNSGTYDIKTRLDVATDRLIENLITEEMKEDESKDTKQFLQ